LFKTLEFHKEGNIAIVTVNRPEVLNAINEDMLDELNLMMNQVEKDKEIRVLIITGAGRAFIAGADIKVQSTFNLEDGRAWGRNGALTFRRLEELRIPTISAVNGFALGGGCELALSCDLIIASDKAKFGQPEVSLGITPGFSGTQRLPRRVGISKAKELIFTGEIIDAGEAEKIGLANKVVPHDDLMLEAQKVANRITDNGPIAVRYAKAAINRGFDAKMDSGIAIETEFFAMCFETEDQKEGMRAFLEKKSPIFTNK
jgi:enoyl-CoA hydratase